MIGFILGAIALLLILGSGATILTVIAALVRSARAGWDTTFHDDSSRPPKSAPGWRKNSGGPRGYR